MSGRHHKADGTPPGRDKLYPRHSAEDMRGDTGTLTSVDLQRLAGISPRDTPPGGLPVSHPPHRRRREKAPEKAPRGYESGVYRLDDDVDAGRSVDPPLRSRVIAAIIVIAVLVTMILLLGGSLWV